jgi:hypothetical protein
MLLYKMEKKFSSRFLQSHATSLLIHLPYEAKVGVAPSNIGEYIILKEPSDILNQLLAIG